MRWLGSGPCAKHQVVLPDQPSGTAASSVNFSAPRKGSGLCKISRQELETAAAVHLPRHCQFLEITVALCQDRCGTERRRSEREAWPTGPWILVFLLDTTIYSLMLTEDDFIANVIFFLVSQYHNQKLN